MRGAQLLSGLLGGAGSFLRGDPQADRAVPPTGFTATLTLMASAAMALLAVLALALSLAAGRLAATWEEGLAREATLRLPPGADPAPALAILAQTPGVVAARPLPPEEQAALLAPWLGPDVPVADLPLPVLVAVTYAGDFDSEGLALRLAGEIPEAALDDHRAWRAPLARAAGAIRALGWGALALVAFATATVIALAARAALAANAQAIRVLRLVGARDATIARAFVRRFTLRAAWGATLGTLMGLLALALVPAAPTPFLTGLGFAGWGWLAPLLVPPFAAATAFFATRASAQRTLRALP